ncbi:hypothetical protein BHM03_00031589 [Ensete ventricosum]|nr:hypothetical protein BHM03_00031589 [Ensete ventricosum]
MTEYVVTRWYRAPELLLCCDNYGTSIDVWSVGCIFAELLGRKPIFPGTECLNQLKLIISVLGTMSDADIGFIDNPKARQYIKSLPYTPGIPLAHLYPKANPLAIDLLQKMLVFDPSKRISVTEALEHPYMSSLYDPTWVTVGAYIVGVVDHPYLAIRLPLWLTLSSYAFTMLVVLALGDLNNVRVNSTEQELGNCDVARADLTEQELGNCDVGRADPTEQGLGNRDVARVNLTEQEHGNCDVARVDPSERELGNCDVARVDPTEQELGNCDVERADPTE